MSSSEERGNIRSTGQVTHSSSSECLLRLSNWEPQINEIEAIEAIYAEALSNVGVGSCGEAGSCEVERAQLKIVSTEQISPNYFTDLFNSKDVVVITPNALRERLKEVVEKFDPQDESCLTPDLLSTMENICIQFRSKPLMIFVFLKSCVHLTTNIGFQFTLNSSYPVSSKKFQPIFRMMSFQSDTCEMSVVIHSLAPDLIDLEPKLPVDQNPSLEIYSIKDLILSHSNCSVPICSVPIYKLRDIENELKSGMSEGGEILNLIIQRGEVIEDGTCFLIFM